MLLSRVADSLYWIARYLERAGHTIRLIDVRLDLELDRRARRRRLGLRAAVRRGEMRRTSRGAVQPGRAGRNARVRRGAIRGSVLACITSARENARQVREEISSDMWEQLNALYLRLKQVRGEGTLVGAAALPVAADYRGRPPVRRRHRLDDGPRRGVAVSARGTLHRARGRDRGAGRSAVRGRRRGFPPITSSGSACCGRAPPSKRTAATTPPTSGRIASRSSCC